MNPSELGYHQPHTTESVFAPVPGLAQVSLGWSALNATLSNAIPAGSRDVRGFSTVQFRASVNYTDARNPVGLPRDLSVVLTDGAGASASARVSDFSPALFYPPGQQFAVPKVFDNTVQLPLSAFSAINLGDVRTVVLRFDRQAAGALLITDLAFANPLGARVELTAFVGEATPLPLPAGQMNLEGTFQTAQPIDLSRATLTFQDVLQQSNGTELLTDVPISLKPLPGATPNNATYISLLVPGVTVVITSLVPNTYFVTMTLFNETIRLPSTCTLLGGVAQLTTSLAIDDGSVPVLASTTKTWVCAPSGAYMQAF
jgi:hypothetical protein